VAFRQDIVPLLRQHCTAADCHGGRGTPLHLALNAENPGEPELQRTYATLTAAAERRAASPGPVRGKYLDAGRARTSWLIWQLMGTNTSRAWDRDGKLAAARPRKIRPMPPPGKGAPISEEELRTIVQWIDLGAQYETVTTTQPLAATRQGQAQ